MPNSIDDPTEQSEWRPLRRLLDAMDADVARLYADAQIEGVKPNFVRELIRLDRYGPMTITDLAKRGELTHSAMSQKVAAMRAAGLVRTTTGVDARSKTVALTTKAKRITNRLAAEWRATEAAIVDLEAEIPYPLTRVVADIVEALQRKTFHDRIAERLQQDDAWR